MIGYIYKITNTTNSKVYIGQTDDMSRRTKQHLRSAFVTNDEKPLYRAWRKYGELAFTIEVIFVTFDTAYLNHYEVLLIKEYGSFEKGYNLCEGGFGIRGFKHSEEVKDKIRAMKLEYNPTKGKPLSTEHKEKLSYAFSGSKNHFYGKSHDTKARAKISAANIGKILPAATRDKMSAARIGDKNPMYGKSRPEVSTNNKVSKGYRLLYNGDIYGSMREIALTLKISRNTISDWIKSGKATKLPKET